MNYYLKNGNKLVCPHCKGEEWKFFKFGVPIEMYTKNSTEYWCKYTCLACSSIQLFNNSLLTQEKLNEQRSSTAVQA